MTRLSEHGGRSASFYTDHPTETGMTHLSEHGGRSTSFYTDHPAETGIVHLSDLGGEAYASLQIIPQRQE